MSWHTVNPTDTVYARTVYSVDNYLSLLIHCAGVRSPGDCGLHAQQVSIVFAHMCWAMTEANVVCVRVCVHRSHTCAQLPLSSMESESTWNTTLRLLYNLTAPNRQQYDNAFTTRDTAASSVAIPSVCRCCLMTKAEIQSVVRTHLQLEHRTGHTHFLQRFSPWETNCRMIWDRTCRKTTLMRHIKKTFTIDDV
jgi:hypothetical protein